jgi:ABC-2 type transport system ATP-binding protein
MILRQTWRKKMNYSSRADNYSLREGESGIPPRSKILETRGLSKRFHHQIAVDNLSLEVYQGDIYGFIGPNGAGKTTTIRMILGLIRPSRGQVSVFGRELQSNFLQTISQIGALVEGPAFYPYLSARTNLQLLCKLSGSIPDQRVDEVLELVGLSKRSEDKVKTYSEGMKQRLGIAQALLSRPRLLVLDEPTKSLDPQGMREIRNLIRYISQEEDTTIFLSSHLLGEMEQVCNRIAIINRGKLIKQGKVEQLLGSEMDRIRIRVNQGDRAQQYLSHTYPSLAVKKLREDWLEIKLKDDQVAKMNMELIRKGFEVSAVVPRTKTLEQYFVELTGESHDVH